MYDFLNEKPSERIRFASIATKEFEQREGCRADMRHFHYNGDDFCYACYGGSAAIKKVLDLGGTHDFDDNLLNLSLKLHISTGDIHDYENSLDFARVGWIGEMFSQMNLSMGEGNRFNTEITCYHDNRDKFFEEMEQLAKDLEKAGY